MSTVEVGGKRAVSYLAKIFKIDRKGINLTQGLEVTGVLVMFPANLLQKRTAKVAPQASAHEGQAG